MRGNGLIVAFLVVVWAAYFVPLVLRRYDEAGKSSTVEKLSPLSRTVARRTESRRTGTGEEATMDTHDHRPAGYGGRTSTSSMGAVRLAASRRRRVLTTLIIVTVGAAALAWFSVTPVWTVAIPVGLDVAWLVACRVQVRSERGLSQRSGHAQRRVAAQPETIGGTAFDAEQTVEVSGFFADPNPERQHSMASDAELPDDALEEKLAIAVPVGSTEEGALWDPLPVTVPTYVTKPRAGRTVRTIDLGEPGSWTSGHIEGEDVELPQSASPAEAARDVG